MTIALDRHTDATAMPTSVDGSGLESAHMTDPQNTSPDTGWTTDTLTFITAHRGAFILAGLTLTVAFLTFLVYRIAKSRQPDRWVSYLAVALGFGWSAEAMWEVATQKLDLPAGFAALAFMVFESMMLTAMLRAERHRADRKRRDRHASAAWLIAAAAGFVVIFAADSVVEAVLRPAIPLLVIYQWWVGLTDEDPRREGGESSWAWTPHRFLVWIGAKRPGAEDTATIDARYRVRRMTRLYHRYESGLRVLRPVRAGRLARLSLDADAAIIAQVRANVRQSSWFKEGNAPADVPALTPAGAPGLLSGQTADSDPGTVPASHPGGHPDNNPGDQVDTEAGIQAGTDTDMTRATRRARKPSPAQVKARKLKSADPDITWAQLAKRVGANERTVRRWFEQDDADALAVLTASIPAPSMNGRTPHLTPTPKES